jgi:hypothetical protein
MNLGKITLISPPDRLFNMNISYLLIAPSTHVKQQFQTILSTGFDDINVFIYENDESDISWVMSTAFQVDVIIIDVDNCDSITRQFISFILAQPNSYYITNDESVPFDLISKNRIYNLDWLAEQLRTAEEDDDDEQDD